MNQKLIFLTAGVGDNLLTLPLLLELEKLGRLEIVVLRESEREFFQAIFKSSRVVKVAGLGSLLRHLPNWLKAVEWIYPIGSCNRKYRLFHLLAFWKRAIGFTSLAGERTWQAEIGLKYTLLPDLARRAWQNNLRLLEVLSNSIQIPRRNWEYYRELVQSRLPLRQETQFEPGIVIHAGSNQYMGGLEQLKRWPLKEFFDFVSSLRRVSDLPVYWVLGPGEEAELGAIEAFCKKNSGQQVILTKQHFNNSLVELFGFLSQQKFFAGNDSGICHLSTLTSVPLLSVVSGIGQVHYTGQNGENAELVWDDVPCRGCTVGIPASIAVGFRCHNNWACMSSISAERVFQVFQKRFGRVFQ